nr:MAG TPA: hypothetical protein [Caudoviricetes sp.]DAZ06089.1 MAG TPA: hypothetical protein [Caudoviricetes sp.]
MPHENTPRPRRPVGRKPSARAIRISATFTSDSGLGLRAQKSGFKRGIKPQIIFGRCEPSFFLVLWR